MKILEVLSGYSCLRFLLLIICITAIGGFGVPIQARSLAEIQETKEIHVCIAPVAPAVATVEPADCRENCKYRGPFYEIAMAFVETLGNDIKHKFLRVDWDEQFFNKEGVVVREDSYSPELLASGICDFYSGAFAPLPWRLKKLDFVVLSPTRTMVVANKSKKAQLKTATDLCGKVTAVVKDTNFHTWLQEQNKIMCAANPIGIELVKSGGEVWKALEEGRADFALGDSTDAFWDSHHQWPFSKSKNFHYLFPVGPSEYIGWAFRREDKDLQAAVKKFFDTQRADKNSPLNAIWKKEFGMTLIDYIELITWIK